MSEVKVLRFRFLPLTRELLFLLSKKHECSKSEMVRRMIHEKAELELLAIKPVVEKEVG